MQYTGSSPFQNGKNYYMISDDPRIEIIQKLFPINIMFGVDIEERGVTYSPSEYLNYFDNHDYQDIGTCISINMKTILRYESKFKEFGKKYLSNFDELFVDNINNLLDSLDDDSENDTYDRLPDLLEYYENYQFIAEDIINNNIDLFNKLFYIRYLSIWYIYTDYTSIDKNGNPKIKKFDDGLVITKNALSIDIRIPPNYFINDTDEKKADKQDKKSVKKVKASKDGKNIKKDNHHKKHNKIINGLIHIIKIFKK